MTANPRPFPATPKISIAVGAGQAPGPAGGAAVPSAPQPAAAQAIALLEQQAAFYEQLQTLSQAQGPLIDDGPSDALLTLLARRQGLIAQLAKLAGQIKPLLARWTDVTASWSPAQREQAKTLLEQFEGRRQAIMEQDERDSERLKQMQAELRIDIERMDRSGKALRAYRPPGFTPGFTPGFIAGYPAGGRGPGAGGSQLTDRKV